ncbi:ankyrin repeat-containing domain protein [Aspergillus insuetus]
MSFVLSFSRLHLAAYFGLDSIIRTLVDDYGVDVNVPDCCGAMPLHWAAGYGNKDAVKLLLDRNADVLARDGISSGGGTALTRVIDWEAVATEWTRADDQNAVRESAQLDAVEIVQLLLKSGAMVNFVYHVPECRFPVVSVPGRDVELDKKNGYMSHVFVFQSYTPLMRASQVGNLRLVQQLLFEGADLNGRGSHGWNALHYAILEQREDVVQLLLDQGIDTGIEDHELDEKPSSSSIYPMQKRKEKIMQTISSVIAGRMNRLADLFDASPLLYMDKASPFPHGLDRNDPFTNNLTFKFKPVDPLIATTRSREAAWVRLMLKDNQTIHRGRDDDRTTLSWAAELGEVKIMDALLRSEARLSIAERDRGGRDALSWAAQGGHLEAVKFLIRKGLSTGSSDRCGYTPLMWAVMCQKIPTVRYLLDKKKADVHANDKSGQSALTWAARVGNPELISFLLERHAVLDHEDRMGSTPLTWAAACGKCDAVRELLRHGANESHRDRNGHTPLFWAVKGGHLSIIRIFHDRGQSLDDRDNEGRTPLHWAAGRGHGEAVKYLLSHGVDMNSHDHSRVNALSWAASGGHDRVTESLLKAGANPNGVDNEGSTPILCAARGASALTIRGRGMYTDAASLNPLLPVKLSVSGDLEGFREAMALPYDFHPNWVLEYENIHHAPKVVVTLLKHGADIESR